MSERLEKLLEAVGIAFRCAGDDRAVRILEQALRTLVTQDHPRDALGAPTTAPRVTTEAGWEELRSSVRAVAGEIGWPEVARRFGGREKALQEMIWRTRPPGIGRQARLLRVVGGRDTRH